MQNYYYQDESGQWWHQGKRQRTKATVRTCAQCGKQFPNRRPINYCSQKCVAETQKGNQRGARPCAWCDQSFIPKGRGNRQICCSKRCAYDLGNLKRGRKGEENGNWKGGVAKHGNSGYLRQYVPGRGHLLQHRVVMEQMIGRELLPHEEVHHKNGIRYDNRPENLELWAKRQPGGQRVSDLIEYAHWVLETYKDYKLT